MTDRPDNAVGTSWPFGVWSLTMQFLPIDAVLDCRRVCASWAVNSQWEPLWHTLILRDFWAVAFHASSSTSSSSSPSAESAAERRNALDALFASSAPFGAGFFCDGRAAYALASAAMHFPWSVQHALRVHDVSTRAAAANTVAGDPSAERWLRDIERHVERHIEGERACDLMSRCWSGHHGELADTMRRMKDFGVSDRRRSLHTLRSLLGATGATDQHKIPSTARDVRDTVLLCWTALADAHAELRRRQDAERLLAPSPLVPPDWEGQDHVPAAAPAAITKADVESLSGLLAVAFVGRGRMAAAVMLSLAHFRAPWSSVAGGVVSPVAPALRALWAMVPSGVAELVGGLRQFEGVSAVPVVPLALLAAVAALELEHPPPPTRVPVRATTVLLVWWGSIATEAMLSANALSAISAKFASGPDPLITVESSVAVLVMILSLRSVVGPAFWMCTLRNRPCGIFDSELLDTVRWRVAPPLLDKKNRARAVRARRGYFLQVVLCVAGFASLLHAGATLLQLAMWMVAAEVACRAACKAKTAWAAHSG